jgi:hypothetical protein
MRIPENTIVSKKNVKSRKKREFKKRKEEIVIILTLGSLTLWGWVLGWYGHLWDDQVPYGIERINHPETASRGESIEFGISAICQVLSYDKSYLKIFEIQSVLTISGEFYWYREKGRMYAMAMRAFTFNFTKRFSIAGNWTIQINGYNTSIIII